MYLGGAGTASGAGGAKRYRKPTVFGEFLREWAVYCGIVCH